MNKDEQEKLEAELMRITPARPPETLMARLLATKPPVQLRSQAQPIALLGMEAWRRAVRWFAPATVIATAAIISWRVSLSPVTTVPMFKADDVHIDRELVSTFDAVARLPDGESIRFRCQKWMDRVVLSDKRLGTVIEQRTPRVEVVPVRFETY